MNGLLSVSETAVVLGCTRQSVLELIQRGRLRAAKLGNQWTIKRGDVVGYQWEKARREAGK